MAIYCRRLRLGSSAQSIIIERMGRFNAPFQSVVAEVNALRMKEFCEEGFSLSNGFEGSIRGKTLTMNKVPKPVAGRRFELCVFD